MKKLPDFPALILTAGVLLGINTTSAQLLTTNAPPSGDAILGALPAGGTVSSLSTLLIARANPTATTIPANITWKPVGTIPGYIGPFDPGAISETWNFAMGSAPPSMAANSNTTVANGFWYNAPGTGNGTAFGAGAGEADWVSNATFALPYITDSMPVVNMPAGAGKVFCGWQCDAGGAAPGAIMGTLYDNTNGTIVIYGNVSTARTGPGNYCFAMNGHPIANSSVAAGAYPVNLTGNFTIYSSISGQSVTAWLGAAGSTQPVGGGVGGNYGSINAFYWEFTDMAAPGNLTHWHPFWFTWNPGDANGNIVVGAPMQDGYEGGVSTQNHMVITYEDGTPLVQIVDGHPCQFELETVMYPCGNGAPTSSCENCVFAVDPMAHWKKETAHWAMLRIGQNNGTVAELYGDGDASAICDRVSGPQPVFRVYNVNQGDWGIYQPRVPAAISLATRSDNILFGIQVLSNLTLIAPPVTGNFGTISDAQYSACVRYTPGAASGPWSMSFDEVVDGRKFYPTLMQSMTPDFASNTLVGRNTTYYSQYGATEGTALNRHGGVLYMDIGGISGVMAALNVNANLTLNTLWTVGDPASSGGPDPNILYVQKNGVAELVLVTFDPVFWGGQNNTMGNTRFWQAWNGATNLPLTTGNEYLEAKTLMP